MTYEQVGGWMDYQGLYTAMVEKASDGAQFVEVGCWLGKSIAFLGQEIKRLNKKVDIFAVDNWAGSECDNLHLCANEYNTSGWTLLDRFKYNIAECGVSDLVTVIVSDSAAGAAMFEDGTLDFVFIDADHRYDAVKKDVESWLPKVKKGGTLAGHDINRSSVYDAVKDTLGAIHKWDGPGIGCWFQNII